MSDINHSSSVNKLRQRVAEREQGRARVVSVTTIAAVASVVAAGAVAVTLPGAGPRDPDGGSGQRLVGGRIRGAPVEAGSGVGGISRLALFPVRLSHLGLLRFFRVGWIQPGSAADPWLRRRPGYLRRLVT